MDEFKNNSSFGQTPQNDPPHENSGAAHPQEDHPETTGTPGSGWVFSNPHEKAPSYGESPDYGRTGEPHTGSQGYDSKYSYSSYHSGPSGTPDQQQEGYKWNYEDYRQHQQPREEKKPKKSKGLRVFTMILCGILSAGILGLAGFGAYSMIDARNDAQQEAQNQESDAAVSDTTHLTLNDRPAGEEEQLADGKLTITQRANKVLPSVVGIVSYYQSQNIFSGSQGQGSGIIASEDGYIITNAHVIDGATALKVVLHDGTEYTATLVGQDDKTDLAVIKIDATGLTPAEFGNSDQMQIGEQVITIGNPGGLELAGSITVGYVSALNRPISAGQGQSVINCIQTDAAINPGNSGGALVNEYGQVVGINSQKIAATDYEGIGFAISINEAQPIIDDLISYGYVKGRVRIGITIQEIDQYTARMYGYQPGIGVVAVEQGTPAAQSGLVAGDIITAVDGEAVTSSNDLSEILEQHQPGDKITLHVFRKSLQSYQDDKELDIQVELLEVVPETAQTTTQTPAEEQ